MATSKALLVVIALLAACSAYGADININWGGGTASWSATNNWSPTTYGLPRNTVSGSTAIAIIASGSAQADANLFTSPDAAPTEVDVRAGGILSIWLNTLADHNLVLDGGRLRGQRDYDKSYAGVISVKSDSYVGHSDMNNKTLTLSGTIQDYTGGGTGRLIFDQSTNTVSITHTNNTWTGGVLVSGGYLTVSNTGALGGGNVTVNSGTLALSSGGAFTTGSIIINSGGVLKINNNAVTRNNDIRMSSGAMLSTPYDNSATSYDSWTLSGTIYWYDAAGSAGQSLTMYGTMSDGAAPARLIVDKNTAWAQGYYQNTLALRNANTQVGGGWDIRNGSVSVYVAGGLGTGTNIQLNNSSAYLGVQIDKGLGTDATRTVAVNKGALYLEVPQTYNGGAQPLVTVGSGAAVVIRGSEVNEDFTLNGGMLQGATNKDSGPRTYSGTLTVNSDSYLGTGPWNSALTLSASSRIIGTGKLIKSGYWYSDRPYGGGETITLNAPNTGFSGGWEIKNGTLQPNVAGALGSGTVIVNVGLPQFTGRLYTNANGCLTSASAVDIQADGLLEYNSTETKLVQVETGGMIRRFGGSTQFQYDSNLANQTVALAAGALLDSSLSTGTYAPSYDVVKNRLATGDSLYGLYLVPVAGAVTTSYTFGDNGTGTSSIFRGLAVQGRYYASGDTVYSAFNMTYRGTATEDAGSTAGLGFYAQYGSTLTFDGSVNGNLSRLVVNGTDLVRLSGNGDFKFNGTVGGNFANVEKNGIGMLNLIGDASVSGKTFNMNGGLVSFSSTWTPNGATFNINPGSGLYLDRSLAGTTGTFSIASTSATVAPVLRLANAAGAGSASLFPFPTTGARTKVAYETVMVNTGSLPLDLSNADLILYAGYPKVGTGNWLVANGTRITVGTDEYGNPQMPTDIQNAGNNPATPGKITYAGTGTPVVQIAAPTGKTLVFGSAYIDMTGSGTIIIGDPGTYTTLRTGVRPADISQNGTVQINNLIAETVDIRAGTLYNGGNINSYNAHIFKLAAGTAFSGVWSNSGAPYYNFLLKGFGLVNFTGGNGAMLLTPSASYDAGLDPGDGATAGRLTLKVTGGVQFRTNTVSGTTKYSVLNIDVPSSGGVAGTDFDQVMSDSNLLNSLANANLTVNLPYPNGRLNPNTLATLDMAIISTTNGGTVNTGPFHNVAILSPAGTWWSITSTAIGYSNTQTVLHGSQIKWNAHAGDTTFDSQVNGDDLTTLANNWMATGANWTMGDFTFDGLVNGDDLTVLANHWGENYTGGGAAVPEPASLALLGLGALALIRRRRK